jgi:6,7-dimethyl-8-ribityllumazine synthase
MVGLGLVVAEYYDAVADPMAERAREAAAARDAEVVAEVRVPGAYDAPLAADRLARRDAVDAVVALGAIVTGDTGHDEVIGHATAQALTDVSLDRDVPVTLGIAGPGMSAAEARERIDKATEAVEGAVSLAGGLPDADAATGAGR